MKTNPTRSKYDRRTKEWLYSYFVGGGPWDRQWHYANHYYMQIAEYEPAEVVWNPDPEPFIRKFIEIKYHFYEYRGVKRFGKPVFHYAGLRLR